MSNILNEEMIKFNTLERKVYDFVCELGREMIKTILENWDKALMENRDRSKLRHKGKRETSIKTVMGTVEYMRNVYMTKDDEGHTAWAYLLDEEIGMDKIGLISTNLAEKIVSIATDNSFRNTADTISKTCGQSISHGGAWLVLQSVGERISDEEDVEVSKLDADTTEGVKEIGILFEEMDGVWLKMQDKNHKKIAKKEVKVATIYEGWIEDGRDNKRLYNKKVIAGLERSEDFHNKREAQIRSIYNADEIKYRVLNGDGGSWIKDPYDSEVVFQLDAFHIQQGIKRGVADKEASKEAEELFERGKYDELIDYIKAYATSVETADEKDNRSKKAMELLAYLENNYDGLMRWQTKHNDYPEAPKGVVYKNMGVQENQNFTIITNRMKGGRRRWSIEGANNMAKVLYTKENKELVEVIERYTDGLIYAKPIEEVFSVLSAAKAPKKDGKGSTYMEIIKAHLPIIDAVQTESRKVFKRIYA